MSETRSVLVCEDDPVQLAILSAALGQAGFTAVTARSPEEALQKVKAQPADAVIADVRLDHGDAFEVLGSLRKAGYAAPVLMVSGHADAQTRGRAIEAGASGLLEKPLNLRSLVRMVRSMVARPSAMVTASLKVLVVDADDPQRRRLAAMVEGAGLRVEAAAGLAAAIDLVKQAKVPYDFAVLDLKGGGATAVETLLAADPGLYLVASGAPSLEMARASYRSGADALLREESHLPALLMGSVSLAMRKRAATERMKRRLEEPPTQKVTRIIKDFCRPGGSSKVRSARLQIGILAAAMVVGAAIAGVLAWSIREGERAEQDLRRAVQQLEHRIPSIPAGAVVPDAPPPTYPAARYERPIAD